MRCLTEIQPAIKPAGWLASGEYRCFSPVIFWGDESYVIPTGLAATIRTAEAERIGLVSHVYPADVFGSSAASYLDDIRKLSRPCVRLPKRATMRATRAAQGWQGRHMLDGVRTTESVELCESQRFEVKVEKVDPAQFGPQCATCRTERVPARGGFRGSGDKPTGRPRSSCRDGRWPARQGRGRPTATAIAGGEATPP